MRNIDKVWQSILVNQKQTFWTKQGISYSYEVVDNYIIVNNDRKRRISKGHIERALLIEYPTPSKIKREGIWGPSYVYGIITDERIK